MRVVHDVAPRRNTNAAHDGDDVVARRPLRSERPAPRQGMVLSNGERSRVLDELNSILARASIVAEHLEVAAARQHMTTTTWTDDQLDAIIEGARSLRRVVERTPLTD